MGDPVLGALPIGAQALEGAAHALVGHQGRNDALLEADLGGQVQGSQPALFAKVAWRPVQQLAQALAALLRKSGAEALGPR